MRNEEIMNYEAYERRIKKVAKVVNFIRKHLVLISVLLITATVLTTGFFSVRGILLEDVSCTTSEYVYGDELTLTEARALFSKVEYEYAPAGSEEWSGEVPVLPGDYRVRAVSTRGLGTKGYGTPVSFSIRQKPLTLSAGQSQAMYGTDPTLRADGLLSTDRVQGVRFRYDNLADPVNVTATPLSDSIRIVDGAGEDVTEGYAIVTETTSIQLTPAPITLKADDASKYYDTTPLSSNAWSIASGALAHGDRAEVTFDPENTITEPGSLTHLPESVRILKGELDVTGYYSITTQSGTLTVSYRPITFLTGSAEKIYDATPLREASASVSKGGLAEGHTFRVVEESVPSITNVAESGENRLEVRILSADGADVSGWYEIGYQYGALTVRRRVLTVTAMSATKVYDGQPFADDVLGVLASEEGRLESHRVMYSYNVNSGIEPIYAGTYAHILSVTSIRDENGTPVTANYNVTSVPGRLVIEKRKLTLQSPDTSVVYNGTSYTMQGAVTIVSETQPVEGDRLSYQSFDIGESAGSYENAFTVWRVNSTATGANVTENYEFEYDYGVLTIEKRKVTFAVNDESHVYNGMMIHPDAFVYEKRSGNINEGLLTGHSFTYTSFAVGPNAGTYEHRFEITEIGADTGSTYASPVIPDPNTNNLIANYDIRYEYGSLEITKRNITITSFGASKEYDRTPLFATDLYAETYSDSELVEGHFLEWVGDYVTLTEVGTAENTFDASNVRILGGYYSGSSNFDMTDNYNIVQCIPGILEVRPVRLTLTAADQYKIYDGTPFVPHQSFVTITSGSLLSGDTIYYDFSSVPNVTNVWDKERNNLTFTPVITMAKGEDPNECYEISCEYGSLSVLPRPITFTSMGGSKQYDGQSYYVGGLASIEGMLVSGHRYTLSEFGTFGPDVLYAEDGTLIAYENIFTVDSIYAEGDPTKTDLRANYDITCHWGSVWITPIPVTVQVGDRHAEYNGLTHTRTVQNLRITQGAYLSGHTAMYTFVPVGPDVGSYVNAVTVAVYEQTDNGQRDVTHNYDITCVSGTMKITARVLILYSDSGSKVYDGERFNVESIQAAKLLRVDDGVNYVWHTLNLRWIPVGPDVVTGAPNAFEVIGITDQDGNNVTKNYSIVLGSYGTLDITPRSATIGTGINTKRYDGTPLTGNGFEDQSKGENTGILPGHTPILRYTGSQTDIGTSPNTFEIVNVLNEMGQSVLHNYNLSAGEAGELVVERRQIWLITGSASLVYNGQAQKYEEYSYYEGSDTLLAGDELRVSFTVSVTDVAEGEKRNSAFAAVVRAESGKECVDGNGTPYYAVVVRQVGTIRIVPLAITVTSKSNVENPKIYDGYALSLPEWSASAEAAPGQWLEVQFLPESTVIRAGSYPNLFTVQAKWEDGSAVDPQNYTITRYYGRLLVERRPITLRTESAEKFYDGTALRHPVYGFDAGSFADTDIPTVVVTGVQNTVGRSENTATVTINHETEGDVTDCYAITYVEGILTIKPGKLYVASHSALKIYDGTPLTCNEYDVDGLLPTDTLEVIFYGSQTQVGSSYNFFTVLVNGSTDLKNYELVPLYGTLVVNASGPLYNVIDPEIPPRDPSNPEMSDSAVKLTDLLGTVGEIKDGEGESIGGSNEGIGGSHSGNLDISGTNGADNMLGNSGNTDGVAMRLTSDHAGKVYMRYMSFGNYSPSNDTWLKANPYTGQITVNPLYFSAMKFMQMGLEDHYLKVTLTGTQFMLPYYSMYGVDESMENDVLLSYSRKEYEIRDYRSFNFEQEWMWYDSELTAEFTDPQLAAWENAYAAFVRANYLSVPSSVEATLQNIALQNGWTAGDLSLINKIAAYIRNVAVYGERSTCTTCNDEVTCFLTHNRLGVCWEFAGAATLLYRAMGIPARLTIGYVADTVNGTVEVTGASAHAWVEVYVDNLGWVQIEVTGSRNSLPTEPEEPETPDDKIATVTFHIFNTTREYNGSEQFCAGGWLQDLPEGYSYRVITDSVGMGWTTVNDGIRISRASGRIRLEIYETATGKDVTDAFEIIDIPGTLKIIPKKIVIQTASATGKQSGSALTADNYWIVQGELLEGDKLSITGWLHTAVKPGTYANAINEESGWTVVDANGVDQTRNYELEVLEGTLTVTS